MEVSADAATHQQLSTNTQHLTADTSAERNSPAVTLADIGELPSSIIASLVAQISTDFCALRLSCKAASGTRSASTYQPGLCAQTTYLQLSTRALEIPAAAFFTSKQPVRSATKFITQQCVGVKHLTITQPSSDTHIIVSLEPFASILPHLLTLSLHARGFGQGWDQSDVHYLSFGIGSISRLHCLESLTLDHCILGVGLSHVIAELTLLTALDLTCSEGVGILAVSNLQRLKQIGMPHTDVTELTVSNCPTLSSLDADFSLELNGFAIDGCAALIGLTMMFCSDLSKLNVSSCTALETLIVSDSEALIDLVARGCLNLRTLHAESCNLLEEIDITGCARLATLKCSSLAMGELELATCVGLKHLLLHNANLSALSACPTLQELHLRDCPCLSALDLSLYSQLRTLKVSSSNMLELLHVADLDFLTELEVCNCHGMTAMLVSHCSMLSSVRVEAFHLPELRITDLPLLHNLHISSIYNMPEGESELQVRNCPTLTSMTIHHATLTALDVSGTTSLNKLDASGCVLLHKLELASCPLISEVLVAQCSSLQQLDIGEAAQLHSLNLSQCRDLVYTNPQLLNSSSLTSLHVSFNGCLPDLSSLPMLSDLHLLSCSSLTTLDLSSCCGFLNLRIYECDMLRFIPLLNLSKVRELAVMSCSSLTCVGGEQPLSFEEWRVMRPPAYHSTSQLGTALEQLCISSCSALQHVDLSSYPRLNAVAIKECSSLKALKASSCHSLEVLKVRGCTALTTLAVSGLGKLGAVEFEQLSNLLNVGLTECVSLQRLTITGAAFDRLDLPGCRVLRLLNLGSCRNLRIIAATSLPLLTHVNVYACPSLQAVQLTGSTANLRKLEVGLDSDLAPMDLTEATVLEMTFSPARSTDKCPVCKTRTASHGFLHSTTVHRVCSICAYKASRWSGSAYRRSCPVCSSLGHLATFSDKWF